MEKEVKDKEVIYTKKIPQCPYCKKPTLRRGGESTTTLMYFAPRYDRDGNNINPDKNIVMAHWYCEECSKNYTTKSNHEKGYYQ